LKDKRVAFLRDALDALVESLDATVRIARWPAPDAIPEPLKTAAGKLLDRLGSATRLAAGKFVGPTIVVESLTEMSGAIRRLDTAYVAYRKVVTDTPARSDEAALALEEEIARARR
jgi:hypothetical protein